MSNGKRNNSKRTTRKAAAAPARRLAWQQFQELNFSFYEEHPSEFLHMRIEVLSLMLCDEQQLAPAYAAERRINGIRLGGTTPPEAQKRRRYMQTEAVVILHHAAEMLFRLYYAHLDYPDCPWQGMAALLSFAEFKDKVEKSLSDGFDRNDLADTFLGGTSPEDACIAMQAADFEDAIDGLHLLLTECGNRLLSESFLYNSIKHGLSTVALDESTEIANQAPGGQRVVGHKGPMFAYMHKRRRPGAAASDGEWFISVAGVKIERDLALALLAARAVESLWDVARRKYTGKSGSIRRIGRSVVEMAIYGLLMQSLNIIDTVTAEMPKLKPDGSFGGVEFDLIMNQIPEDYELAEGDHAIECPRINLPTRQRDKRAYSTSKRKLFPFSPNGSQQV